MTTVIGSGGQKVIAVAVGSTLTVDRFGAFGAGTAPIQPGELDTLRFLGAGMTADRMILTQAGGNVVITFDGVPNTQVTLTKMTIDQLENIESKGNFVFYGQSAVTDSVDIWNATQTSGPVAHDDTVTFGNQRDNTISGHDNSDDVIHGLGGNDVLRGLGGNDTLYGDAGNDRLDGGAGVDRMVGGAGNDVYIVDDNDQVVETLSAAQGGGIDTVISSAYYATLGDNVENLILVGDNTYYGIGNDLDNVITAADTGNVLFGMGGNDLLIGGAGNDNLDGGTGTDTMIGGRGDDTYGVDSAKDRVIETLSAAAGGGNDTVVSSISYVLGAHLENLTLTGAANLNGTGNALNNVITGNSGNNILIGDGGNDSLWGQGGKNILLGGDGDDNLSGTDDNHTSVDRLEGGRGNDLYAIDNAGDRVIETLTATQGGGNDTVWSVISYTLGANVENLTLLGDAALNGTGNGLANIITGNDGANVLAAGGGNDTIYGGTGDTLRGEAGNDQLIVTRPGVAQVDGGRGIDTANLDAVGTTIDLTGPLGAALHSIEVVDLGGGQKNILTLDPAIVAALAGTDNGAAFGAHTLVVKGDVGDSVHIDRSWIDAGDQTNPFHQTGTYTKYTSGDAVLFVESDVVVSTGAPIPTLAALNGLNGFQLDGDTNFRYSGWTISSAGDLNGDGFDDAIIGSTYHVSGLAEPGNSYVIFGHAGSFAADLNLADLNGSNGFKLTDPEGETEVVASAGDLNGDGFGDLVIGAPHASPDGNILLGSTYVVFGKADGFGADFSLADLDGGNGFRIDGVTTFDGTMGAAVASAGDINGDGFDDLIIGDPEATIDGLERSGAAYVIFGHGGAFSPDLTTLDGNNGFRVHGAAYGGAGFSVAAAGDVNGDGFGDIVIGAPANYRQEQPGAAYVLFGHSGGFAQDIDLSALAPGDGFKITGEVGASAIGASVASAGDLNGDGFADLIVGAPTNSYGSGDAYVIYGKATGFGDIDVTALSASDGFAIHGLLAGDQIARSVASAGDINGDGYADLIIGASRVDAGGNTNAGSAYVVFGHAGGFGNVDLAALDGTNGFRLDGLNQGDYAGFKVAGAGDVNGDGFGDLMVSADGADPHGMFTAGSSYVIFGGDFSGAVTHLGTTGPDTMTGDSKAETFVGGGGNDTVNGGGGRDSIEAGAGDDQIYVVDNTFFHIDGGGGTDTLHLDHAGAVDFGNLDGDPSTSDRGKITGIETISVDNGQSNAMTLYLADVLDIAARDQDVGGNPALDNLLKIDGNAGDTLHLATADGWSSADTASLAGYAIYSNGGAHVAVEATIAVTVS